jgi:uncharacterized protein
MKWLHLVTYTLVIVGALNWGLVGLFNFNLVTWLAMSLGFASLEMVLYVLVGVSAIYEVLIHAGHCKTCMNVVKK